MPHAAVRSDPANYGRRAVPALRDCNLTRSDMFHPCRLLVFLTLVFVSLLASSPAFATRDTPEDEKSLTIRNESAEELLSIRFTVGNQANYARLDLLPGGEDQLLNPGGTADLRMDMGLYLWDFNKVRLASVQSLTLCGEHHPCLLVRGLDGKISHVNGTGKSLLPAEDARPVCALSKFRPGMLMKDACALLEKDPLRDDGGAVLTSLGFADMVWAARLTPYTPGDDNVEAFPVKAGGEVLEHVELRQKLSDQRLDALLASLYNMGYRPWQAELPGLDMNFTEMPVADQKRQMEILHMALGMLMNAPRGDACIMMAPGDMLPDLISDTPRKDVQLFTITVRRPTATLIVDMTAYSASF